MTRHKSLASAMSALLAYKNRPEGEPAPVQTNWSLTPANDNEPEIVAEMRTERRIQILPTVEEIMRQVATGDVERGPSTSVEVIRDGKAVAVEIPGPIIRIGKLRFSDGTKVERGHKYGPGGDVVATDIRMPVGAMLGCSEHESRTLGGEENPTEVTASNTYFADMFGVKRKRRITAPKKARRGNGLTHTEAKAALADAYTNTPVLPQVKKCPPGLPAASAKVADSFLGMKKAAKGDSGSIGWQDISTALVDREVWAQAIAELSEQDREALDAVTEGRARTMADISPGGHEKAAMRRGKRLLRAANQNLADILQKVAV